MNEEEIVLPLSHAEALVLFEFVSRYSDNDRLEIIDQAEQRVLWNVCCLLEKLLVDPFKPNYAELLDIARNQLRDEES